MNKENKTIQINLDVLNHHLSCIINQVEDLEQIAEDVVDPTNENIYEESKFTTTFVKDHCKSIYQIVSGSPEKDITIKN